MRVKIFSEGSIKKLRELCRERFQQYHADREDIDCIYDLCDWMYRGGSTRREYDKQRRKWVPRYPSAEHSHRSNVGSTLFHRQVNTLAGMLGAILASGRDLWVYKDKPIEGAPETGETDVVTANVMNALAKRVQELDGFAWKIPEFCIDVFKYSNIFVMIGMRRVKGKVWRAVEEAVPTGDFAPDGTPIYSIRRKIREEEGYKYEYPTITIPHPRNVYADKYIPNIADQDVVIVLSTTTLPQLREEGKWIDQESVSKIKPSTHAWDGVYGVEQASSQEDVLERTGGTKSTVFLRWDCYARVPVSKETGEIVDLNADDVGDYEFKLVWAVFIGNDLGESAVCLKVVDGFDPDDEIPIKEIRVNPDSSDMLYHTFLAEIVAPPYAADCALLNAAIDNNALVNDPPKEVIHNAVLGSDFSFESGKVWLVRMPNAVRPVEVRDVTMQTVALREQVERECKRALATDDARLGEYAGARTSATEILRVTGATDVTLAIRMSYIVGQFLPWLARKYVSYIRDFMHEEVMRRLVNGVVPVQVMGKYITDYDVSIDIVTQYEDSMMQRLALTNAMQILAGNPMLMQSDTHRLNVGELVRAYLESNKLPVSRIIMSPSPSDSENNARNRIQLMLLTGVYYPPQDGENYEMHLRIAAAERLRWSGLENVPDERARNLVLLDRYIEDLKSAIQMRNAVNATALATALGGAQRRREMTPGIEIGQAIAASSGGLGGANNVTTSAGEEELGEV